MEKKEELHSTQEIIDAVAKELEAKIDFEVVRYEDEEFMGWELLLCNISEQNGKPIEKDKMYRLSVPVLTKPNHKHKMELAYLKGGRPGLLRYMEKFVAKASMERVRAIVLKKYGEFERKQFEDHGIPYHGSV